jgi:hypothetical protein
MPAMPLGSVCVPSYNMAHWNEVVLHEEGASDADWPPNQPGFEGVLVIDLYNASPRGLTIECFTPFCTLLEFHRLTRPAQSPFPCDVMLRFPADDAEYSSENNQFAASSSRDS